MKVWARMGWDGMSKPGQMDGGEGRGKRIAKRRLHTSPPSQIRNRARARYLTILS